jgi:hypothetical protein
MGEKNKGIGTEKIIVSPSNGQAIKFRKIYEKEIIEID